MKEILSRTVAAGAVSLALFMAVSLRSPLPPAVRAQSDGGPCSPLTNAGSLPPAEIAWRLFVAVNCPVTGDANAVVRWEQWKEQAQIYGPPAKSTAAPARFHKSLLARSLAEDAADLSLTAACAPGNKPAYPGGPKRIICEEVRINPEAASYILDHHFEQRAAQAQVAEKHGTFRFPDSAIEMKMDWIQLDSMQLCDQPPANPSVHVEKVTDPSIGAHCYALAAIHLTSRLREHWVWATWEPQDASLNPRRCFELGCEDRFGATPSTLPKGQPKPPVSTQTPRLNALMKQANLAPEWFNYRLDGVQTDFLDRQTGALRPTLLGNSITEGEQVGMPLTQASCITCHDVSSIRNDATDGSTLLKDPKTGKPINARGLPSQWPPPSDGNWVRRDFVWSLEAAK
jgi:hypothetical protein